MKNPKKRSQWQLGLILQTATFLGLFVAACVVEPVNAKVTPGNLHTTANAIGVAEIRWKFRPPSACQQVVFTPAPTLATGLFPASVMAADFNHDHRPDLAIANQGDHNISVLMSVGANGFSAPVNYMTGLSPSAVEAVDFNRDGNLDLVTANSSSESVSWLLGDGMGGFRPALSFRVGLFPSALVVGDFNNDGIPDFTVANLGSDSVTVLLGDGAGGVSSAHGSDAGAGPSALARGDFNRDGALDLVVVDFNGRNIALLLGNNTGSFSMRKPYPAGLDPRGVATGDFNADGSLDVAVTDNGSNQVLVMLGDGVGGLNTPVRFAVGTNPLAVVASDFNRDKKLDLAVANAGSNDVSLLIGDGNGSFVATGKTAVGIQPSALTAADFDDDGDIDLVTTNRGSGDASLLLNACQIAAADLSLHLRPSSERVLIGDSVTWTIEVRNNGPEEAFQVIVTDLFDRRLTVVSCDATNGGICAGDANNRIVRFSSLPVGAQATVHFVTRLNCTIAGNTKITNAATVKAATDDPLQANNFDYATVRTVNAPPKITGVSVDKPVLWPPNRKMVDVMVRYNATDHCESPANLRCQLSVRSNEPSDPTKPDWEIVDAHHIRLRAERLGKGNGRIYTITILCRDQSGNTSIACTTVTVPKSFSE